MPKNTPDRIIDSAYALVKRTSALPGSAGATINAGLTTLQVQDLIDSSLVNHRAESDPHTVYLTQTEGDARYSLLGHTHDDRYYTETESDTLFVKLATAGTIIARHTFNPGSAASPFILGANAQGQLVTGLNSDLLDGYDASAFPRKTENATITGQWTISPGSAMAPFVLGVNAQNQLVSGLNADQLDGFDSTAFPRKAENATVSGSWTFGVDLALASAAQIDFADVAEDKIYWYSNTYGTGVEGYTLTHWSAANHRWRVGGTSASTGTQKMILNSVGLQIGATSGTASAALDVTGSALISGQITVGSDTDATNVFGRGKLYSGFTDEILLAHFDHANTADYALRQNSLADTVLNAATERSIYHRINNTDTMIMNSARLNPAGSISIDLGDYNRKWRTLYASELYVETLVAQDVISTIGGRVMVTPTTKLIADLASGATTIDVANNNLVNGEYIYMSSAPGGVAQVEAMKITSSATAITGGYRYNLTRNLDGSGANNWVAGDAVASLGATVGSGYIDLTATSTIHGHAGPTMAIYQRTSTGTWNGTKPSVAIGNLRSFVDYSSDTAGIAHGNDLTLTPTGGFSGMTSDNTNGLRLFNTTLSMYISGAKSAEFTTGGGVNFYVLGNNTVDSARSVSFIDTSANEIGKLGAYYFSASGIHGLYLSSAGVNGRVNQSYFAARALNTTAGTGKQALMRVSAESYGGTDQGLMAGLWLSANKIMTAESYIDLGFSQSVPGTANTDGAINLRAGYVTLSSSILNSNDGIRLSAGAGWTNYPSSGNGSEIANNLSTYKALILAGNKSDSGSQRRLMLLDHAHIGSNVLGNTVYPGLTGGNTDRIFSLAVNGFGRSTALMANAYKSADSGHLYTSGQATYYGGQAAGTAPLMFHLDPNEVEFKWYYGPTNLASGTSITSWTLAGRLNGNYFGATALRTLGENVDWKLSGYTAGAPAATGYVTVKIGGTNYKLLAST